MSSACCDVQSYQPKRLRLHALSSGVALFSVLVGWLLLSYGPPGSSIPLLVLAYAAGGWNAAVGALQALRCRELDVDVLMLLAAGGAATVGHWIEGAVLLFLFSLGNTLEMYAFGRTRRSIEALMELRPEEAVRLLGGAEVVVPLEDLHPNDVVRVKPGDRIPVDGVVVHGGSRVDESTLTGEPTPVTKVTGDGVFAGTLNGPGSLDIRMSRPASDTALARIIALVEEAREARAPTQSWIEAIEGRYALGVILAALAAILLPWLGLGWAFDDAFYRAMTLLVVASPCALVISIPATIVSAVSNGARHGILFKGGAHLDALSEVTIFALDKTGTVTAGRPKVVSIHTDRDETHLIRLAAGAESRSEHHLGAAIVRSAEDRNVDVPEPTSFVSVPGRGVEATVERHRVEVGKQSWVEERTGSAADEETIRFLESSYPTATPVHIAIDGSYAGAFAIQDHPREGTRGAMDDLAKAGVTRTVMLTGDALATANAVAELVGIREVHAALLPQDKSRILSELRQSGSVAMVGDGVNDAPALAVADVGIAIGAAGTDVALETADVVVMGEDLASLARAVRLSHRTRRVVRQNLVFSVTVMIGLVGAALTGWIGLTAGVIGHEGSTIVVVLNGLRLLGDGR